MNRGFINMKCQSIGSQFGVWVVSQLYFRLFNLPIKFYLFYIKCLRVLGFVGLKWLTTSWENTKIETRACHLMYFTERVGPKPLLNYLKQFFINSVHFHSFIYHTAFSFVHLDTCMASFSIKQCNTLFYENLKVLCIGYSNKSITMCRIL